MATQTVQGIISVLGRAASDDFVSYSVEWAREQAPDVWVRHWSSTRQVEDGVLAAWDSRTVPNGRYTLRVVLRDGKRGELRFTVPIVVDNGEDGAERDLAPWAEITGPLEGSTIAGSVEVGGSVVSEELVEAVLEFGVGLQPAQWTELARITVSPTVRETLALWETTEVPDGTYSLRITVRDRRLGSTEIRTVVTIRNDVDD